ncbi:SDR family oxidoreductase [Streptomyces clavuligerus]|uniref:SDR family oxidoreductase n=1 Tax=Streptomyces clavuligerus TaxID=1901 RepID=UPI001F0738E4|nr:SDR family oxidoreductase [Streptomyces clavuligerus]
MSAHRPLLDTRRRWFDEVLRDQCGPRPLALAQPALPRCGKSGGLVVNLSSVAGGRGLPLWRGSTAASKAALDQATRVLAVEIADSGRGRVSVDPGRYAHRGYEQAEPASICPGCPCPRSPLPFWELADGAFPPTEVNARAVPGRQSGPWEPGPR